MGAEAPTGACLSPERLALGASFYLSSLLLFVGLRSRASALVLGTTLLMLHHAIGVGQGVDDFVHHHTYLEALATLFLAGTPCGRSYSVDRWLTLQRGLEVAERGNVLGLRLIVVLLSSAYLWGTWTKLTPGFLSGDRMEQIFLTLYWGSDRPATLLGAPFGDVMRGLSWATVALEPLLAVALWVPRARGAAVLVGILFHMGIYYLLPVGSFSAAMVLLYLAAFDPDAVHAHLDRLGAGPEVLKPAQNRTS